MAKKGHGQWNIMASVLIDSGKYFDARACTFTDELSVAQFCQKNPLLREYISNWLSKLNDLSDRTLEATNRFRTKGNKHFDEIVGQNDLAADCYTKAIFCAPKDSVELALAHANRAACSVTSDRFYEEGYFDCKLALQFNYPKEKLRKLFERKQYLANQTDKNEEYSAETYLEMKAMHFELDEERNAFLEEYQAKVKTNQAANNIDSGNSGQPASSFKNKNLIEKCGPSVGRYLITDEAIKKDQQIYCDKAFSFVPAFKYDYTDTLFYSCQQCAKSNCLPFPCYDCARASYCSPVCTANHTPIHKYECVGYRKNLWLKLGIGYLAFRTFIVGFEELLEMVEKKKSTVEEVWSALMSGQQKAFPYGNVLRLISHVDKVKPRNVLRYALTSQLMTIYLSEYTDFFSNLPAACEAIMSNEDWKTLASALMLRHMGQAYFNGHTQSQLQLTPPTLYNKTYGYGSNSIHLGDLHMVLQSTSVFSAFFPKLSIVNHSCDPNTRFTVDGSSLSIHATRDIGANEEIFTSYGPLYKLSSTLERQTQLQTEFLFDCKCNRCVTDDDSYKKYYEYYCPNESCRSLVELNGVDLRWWYYLNDDYCSRINDKFQCNKCGTRLTMNPTIMQKFEKAAQGQIDKGYTFYSTDDYVITKNLLDMYFRSSQCLGAYHELKSRLAHMVLGYRMLESKEDIFPRLAYITMENYVNRLERYGLYALEFILVSTQALSILKMAKIIERTNTLPEMARDIAKIRKILDINEIEKSLTILPSSLQMVFKNVIRDLAFDGSSVYESGMMAGATVSDRFNVSGSFNLAVCTDYSSEKSVG